MEAQKPCRVCKEVKPVSEFVKQASRADGTLNVCKPCHNAYPRNRAKKENMTTTSTPKAALVAQNTVPDIENKVANVGN